MQTEYTWERFDYGQIIQQKKILLYNIVYFFIYLTAEFLLDGKKDKRIRPLCFCYLIFPDTMKKDSTISKRVSNVFGPVFNNLALLLGRLHLSLYNKLAFCWTRLVKISPCSDGSLQCLIGRRCLLKAAPLWTFHSLWDWGKLALKVSSSEESISFGVDVHA